LQYNLEREWQKLTREVHDCAMSYMVNLQLIPPHNAPLPHSYDAPDPVPSYLIDRLTSMAESMGYAVIYCDLSEHRALGRTQCIAAPQMFAPVKIELDPKMNIASRLRVLAHELGHALLNEPGRHDLAYRMNRHSNDNGLEEETTVQCAAAMFLRALGYRQERFSAHYLLGVADGLASMEKAKPKAIALADALLRAVA
jgi:hypothetical protein